MIETQVAQLASSCLNANMGKLPGQLEVTPKENVIAVTTRGDKSTREPPFQQDARTRRKAISASHADAEEEEQEEAVDSNTIATRKTPWNPLELHGITTIQLPYRFQNG